jgi:DNA (cytosine-5)-methyltransferase 1
VKHLDLFSGIGGFALGLQKVGFETVAFCDIEKYCQHLLKQKWNGIKIYSDVREITKEKFKADGIESPDIITGGFPCQPFSVAGKQKGTDDDRHLWPEMFRIIKAFKPRFVIGENVPGIVNIQDGVVFETVCTDLESQGYEVQPFNIPAAAVGAPHQRKRIWIIATLANTKNGRGQPSQSERWEGTKRGSIDSRGIEGERKNFSSSQSGGNFWDIEPDVGRVVNGLPGRVHRLKGLGNAIVPQIAEEIGRAIMKAEQQLIEEFNRYVKENRQI